MEVSPVSPLGFASNTLVSGVWSASTRPFLALMSGLGFGEEAGPSVAASRAKAFEFLKASGGGRFCGVAGFGGLGIWKKNPNVFDF